MRTTALILLVLAAMAAPAMAFTRRAAPKMNFFNDLAKKFFPTERAQASHILVSGPNRVQTLEKLKAEIDNDPNVFADKAAAVSECPSGRNGGALGTFKPGQMVPAFDKVCFDESYEIGVVHGPVGYAPSHL
mmetsp:Transcript_16134/g.49305  ORF Transcript_16134/g.49305 Transcript_16134/m.49305 type:complete len:132 (-) Transcript_16134:798-1193(-)